MLGQLFKHWTYRVFAPGALLRSRYEAFKSLLERDRRCLEMMAELEDVHHGYAPVDAARVSHLAEQMAREVTALAEDLVSMNPGMYMDLGEYAHKIVFYLRMAAQLPDFDFGPPYTTDLDEAAGAPERAGGKAANLARVATATRIPVPAGFVLTSNAFHYFIEYNELQPKLDTLLAKVNLDTPGFAADICREMQRLVMEGEIPPAVEAEMRDRAMDLAGRRGGRITLAVRSSAWGEDSHASFAGQYESELHVALSDLGRAYRTVLASKYSAKAVTYRIRYGLADSEAPMAVLVTEMIDAAAAGVMYTRDPAGRGDGRGDDVAVYAVGGQGGKLVDGSSSPEVVIVSRTGRVVGRRAGGGAPQAVVGVDEACSECLDDESATSLARWGLELEALFGGPQDVEWCADAQGHLFVLQSRPLAGIGQPEEAGAPEAQAPDVDAPVLLQGGVCASPGVGAGPVCLAPVFSRLDEVDKGCVLVAETLNPAFASVLDRLAAVVTDTGSRASHFASVAREFGLPVIVDAKFATRTLEEGRMVTVDARQTTVYDGPVEGLEHSVVRRRAEDTPLDGRMEAIMERVARLNLTDPEAPEFTPRFMRTAHDVIRFCHEKAVREMFSLVGRGGRGLAAARQLVCELPLSMYILDLEGGLAGGSCEETIVPECFRSVPMMAVWEGLAHPKVEWNEALPAFDWEEFDRVSGGIVGPTSKCLSSYAVMSRDYLHLQVRFGYHFTVVDTLCSEEAESNYISFRFKGGGAQIGQRLLRLAVVERVLARAGMRVKVTGDMLDAGCDRLPRDQVRRRMKLLGVLMARTRLLDMAMRDEEQVVELADEICRLGGVCDSQPGNKTPNEKATA